MEIRKRKYKKKHRVVEEQNETQETNDSALIFEYSEYKASKWLKISTQSEDWS